MGYVKLADQAEHVAGNFWEKFHKPGDDLYAPLKRFWKVYNARKNSIPIQVPFHHSYCHPEGDCYFTYGITTACNKFVKIGITTNPQKRLYKLQTNQPTQLTIDFMLLGPKSLEKELHRKLAEYNVRGEWFLLTESLIKELEAYEDKSLAYYNQLKAGRRYVGKREINARRKADAQFKR